MKKDWIERELTTEVVVGFFICMMLMGLCYFTFVLSGKNWGKEKYEMNIVFDDVMGLRVRDSVIARGMPIGEVKSLELREEGHGVLVVLELNAKLTMRDDYKVSIISTSILGGRQMQIFEGPPENKLIEGVDEYDGSEPYDIMEDAAELIAVFKDEFVGDGGAIANFKQTTSEMLEIASRLNAGKGTLGRLLSSDDKLYRDVEETVDEVRATIDDYREVAPITTFSSIFFGAF